jgi:hypothetical protein
VKRGQDGSLKAVAAAKHVSEAIRAAVAQKLPEVDQGANHFGFFRKPTDQNIVFYEPALTYDFAELLAWSKSVDQGQIHKKEKGALGNFDQQVKQPWFNVLANAQVPDAQHSCLGRNNTLMTLLLATYSSGWDQERAYNFADEWNSRQREPIHDQDVRRIVRSAFSGKYQGATRHFINELMESYGRGEAAFVSGNHNWVKWAKPRAERKYSHTYEWAKDLIIWTNGQKVNEDGFFRTSTRKIQAALGIQPASLMTVLNFVQEMGLMRIKRVSGFKGGIYLATWTQVGRTIETKKQEQAQVWLDYLGLTPTLAQSQTPVFVGKQIALGLEAYNDS